MKAFFYVSSKALHIDFRIWEVIWFIKETVLRIFPKLFENSRSFSAKAFPTKLISMEHFSPDFLSLVKLLSNQVVKLFLF